MRFRATSAVFLAFIVMFSLVMLTSASSQAAGPGPAGKITIIVTTSMDPVYDAFGTGTSQVVVTINGTLQKTSASQVELVSTFRPTQLNASVVVNGTSEKLPVTVTSGRYGSRFAEDFTIPGNATALQIAMSGHQGGNGFLWRYISIVPTVTWQSSTHFDVPDPSRYINLPQGTIISGLFAFNGTQLPTSLATNVASHGGAQVYSLHRATVTILLQSRWFVPASVIVSALAAIIFALASLNTFSFGRIYLRTVFGRVAAVGTAPQESASSMAAWAKFGLSLTKRIFKPRKLLVLFLLCAVLMVSLGAIGGPDARVHAYIVAAPASVTQIHQNLDSFEPNNFVLTPAQDYSDFEVMSSVGDFNLAVISYYPPLALPTIDGFIVRGLADVPVIVMDKQTNLGLANQINASYGSKVITVQNAANLTPFEKQHIADTITANARVKLLDLNLSVQGFKIVLITEAVLSFVLIFLGWAFIGSLASEARLHSDLSHLATTVSSGAFVFLFSEAVYVTTSILLAYPLSLHAVVSGAKEVTAVSFIGFGGGSTPRLASGVIGVLLGLVLTEGSPKLEKTDLAIILGLGLFIIGDPLVLGQLAFQGLLLFFGNFTFGGAYVGSQSFKGFIYGIGAVLGGGVNSTYLLSAGKMLFFAGLIPLAYLKRMGRTTTALVALIAAFLIGDGGVRVGEMTPAKTAIALVPGLVVGFSFLVVFLVLASAEKYVRGAWAR